MAVRMPQFIFCKVVDFLFHVQTQSENVKNCDIFLDITFNHDLVMTINNMERKYTAFKLSANFEPVIVCVSSKELELKLDHFNMDYIMNCGDDDVRYGK